jgi:hypothetical protein
MEVWVYVVLATLVLVLFFVMDIFLYDEEFKDGFHRSNYPDRNEFSGKDAFDSHMIAMKERNDSIDKNVIPGYYPPQAKVSDVKGKVDASNYRKEDFIFSYSRSNNGLTNSFFSTDSSCSSDSGSSGSSSGCGGE